MLNINNHATFINNAVYFTCVKLTLKNIYLHSLSYLIEMRFVVVEGKKDFFYYIISQVEIVKDLTKEILR